MSVGKYSATRQGIDVGAGLYGFLSKGPLATSFIGKLLLVSAAAALPVTLVAGYLGFSGPMAAAKVVGLIVAASGVGLVLLWLGFRALVTPLEQTRDALQIYADKKILPQLPSDGNDVVGDIMKQSQRAAALMEDARRQRAADRTTDPITGLINQRSAVRRLGQDILRAGRDNRPMSLALVQIDNVEALEGQFDTESLNALCSRVSNTIVKVIRGSDWVAGHGKHDFLVGLWGVKADAALIALGRVAASLREHQTQPVTLSVGIAAVKSSQAPDTAIGNASNAMYKARSAGGNRIVVDL